MGIIIKMKFYQLAALATVSEAAYLTPKVESTPEVQGMVDQTMWFVEGVKGFYDGYYKALYKTKSPDMEACLNEETAKNMAKLEGLMLDPMHAMTEIANIQEDFNLFGEMAEVFENLSKCHFEESAFDIMGMCTKDPEACMLPKLTENMSKQMFVLVGKLTSLGETMDGFPSPDVDTFRGQTNDLGSDLGTGLRIIFDFHKEE